MRDRNWEYDILVTHSRYYLHAIKGRFYHQRNYVVMRLNESCNNMVAISISGIALFDELNEIFLLDMQVT